MTIKLFKSFFLLIVGTLGIHSSIIGMEEVAQARRDLAKNPLALIDAVERGDNERVLQLLAAGARVNAQDSQGNTPLHRAVLERHPTTASLLIENNADINAQNNDGNTPLHLAVLNKSEPMVERLLKYSPNINTRNNTGLAPLHDAIKQQSAAGSSIAHLLMNHGADVNIKDGSGLAPLDYAANFNELNIARELLNKHNADVNTRDNHKWTPLHQAVLASHSSMVELLINHGALVDARQAIGLTPLHMAASDGHRDSAAILLSHKASLEPQDDYGRTPLHWAVMNNQEKMIEFLIDRGASILYPNNHNATPLHYARNVSTLKTLLFPRPARVLPLQQLCLKLAGSAEISPACREMLKGYPESIQKAIASEQKQQRADRDFIRKALMVQDDQGKTPRDWAAEASDTDVQEAALVKFIDDVFRARTPDDLRALGYRD